MTELDTCPNCGFYYELGRKDERRAMNNAQRDGLSAAGIRWYGIWNGSGWIRNMDGELLWGPRSVMQAKAREMNAEKPWPGGTPWSVIAKAFPDPELDEAEAHQQEPEPPPAPDTSFKW